MRLTFIRDAIDRLQMVLAISNIAVFLVILFAIHILNLNIFYSVIFLILLTPLMYLFIGKLLARAKRTLNSQRSFVSNVVHELNSPMSFMQLNSELALHATDSNHQSRLSKIKSQELISALKNDLSGLRNMSNIIKNLSIMTSYEYKPGKLELERVNLGLLLERLCGAVSEQLADNKDINIDIDNKLPAYIMGNEAALEQMIINLLHNAVKYSPAGAHVTASIFNTPQGVTMSIKDTGIGISENDMLRMFDPFYRSSNELARKEEGSGLGLAIVNEVVKGHKAKIFVKSALKKGTEVSVNFPAVA